MKPVLKAMKPTDAIKALAHITGGGFIENIPRVLPKTTVAEIDLGQVPFTPVFEWLQEVGSVAEREMLRTFNCGIGMIVVVAAKDAKKVAASLTKSGETVVTLGTIRKRKGGEEQVALSGHARRGMRKIRAAILISGRGSNMMALVEAARDPPFQQKSPASFRTGRTPRGSRLPRPMALPPR